jgi:hypothetical protein
MPHGVARGIDRVRNVVRVADARTFRRHPR